MTQKRHKRRDNRRTPTRLGGHRDTDSLVVKFARILVDNVSTLLRVLLIVASVQLIDVLVEHLTPTPLDRPMQVSEPSDRGAPPAVGLLLIDSEEPGESGKTSEKDTGPFMSPAIQQAYNCTFIAFRRDNPGSCPGYDDTDEGSYLFEQLDRLYARVD